MLQYDLVRLTDCISVSTLCNGYRMCLSHVRSRKLSELGAKFHHFYRKLGSLSKNMMSCFALEVDKYPKIAPNPKIAQNGDLDN